MGVLGARAGVSPGRFILWDDFRPVEYAHEKTLPVSLFLSLFIGQPTEVQVSQAFNDGNIDVAWNKGVVFTAKLEGLWEATPRVSDEDIRHMRNRVEEFVIDAVLPSSDLKETTPCAVHMAKWIVSESSAWDAASSLQVVLPVQGAAGAPDARMSEAEEAVDGLGELTSSARVGSDGAAALRQDLLDLGAISVRELSMADWTAMPAWRMLRTLEQRRVLQVLFGARAE